MEQRYKVVKRDGFYFVYDNQTGMICSDPFVNRKTADKYRQIDENQHRDNQRRLAR